MSRPRAGERHYHPLAAVQVFRRYLVLALLPLFSALLQWDLAALYRALRQNAVLLAALAVFSLVQTLASGWALGPDGTLTLCSGLVLRTQTRLHGGALAALLVEQPLHYRALGAARLTLYPARTARPITLYLYRRDAQRLAEALLPAPAAGRQVTYRPAGGEWLRFVLLSANAAATGTLAALALRQSSQAERYAEQLALEQVNAVARFAARWLPVGLAWLLAAAGLLLCVSLGRSLLRMGGYRAAADGRVLVAGGGLLARWQTRIRADSLRWADVRRTPTARLLRRWPVYAAAGSFDGALPLAVLCPGDAASLRAVQSLLPGFALPPAAGPGLARGRSTAAFFGVSGGLFGTLLTLTLLAVQLLPAAAPLLAVPTAAAFVLLVVSAEGRRTEGAWLAACGADADTAAARPGPAVPEAVGHTNAAAPADASSPGSPAAAKTPAHPAEQPAGPAVPAAQQGPPALEAAGSCPAAERADLRPAGEPPPARRVLTVRRVQWFTMHEYCLFARPVLCQTRQSPWAVRARRADLTLCLPARIRLRVRSLPLKDAENLRKSV